MTASTFVLAMAGCGVGAVARFWLSTLRRPHHVPWPTVIANVLGTALLGASAALLEGEHLSSGAAFVVGAGVAGGFTTFSTLAVDAIVIWRESKARALAYLAVTLVAGVGAGIVGWLGAEALV